MTILFTGGDLINTAIDIERRGVIFYDIMAKSTENDLARETFQNLADMEREHIKIFEGMLSGTEKSGTDADDSAEYAAYLQSLVDSAVFTDDLVASEMATQADSDLEALELAISVEKDSILFYYEIRGVMTAKFRPLVDRVIAEEKSHLRQLAELKKIVAIP
jgi:rubrerythrin